MNRNQAVAGTLLQMTNDNEKLYQVKREFGFKEGEIRDSLLL